MVTILKERRLPSVISARLKNINFLAFRPIRRTSPFFCNGSADVKIHTLLTHRHCDIYLLSAKSFLRYFSDVAMVVHDDGTLTPSDIRLLTSHIINLKVIKKKEADTIVMPQLDNFFNSLRYRHKLLMKLFDFILMGKKKIIVLDSDIVFQSRPDEIIDWISHDPVMPFYTTEYPTWARPCNFERLKKEYCFAYIEYLNSGFMGFYNYISIAEIEELTKAVIRCYLPGLDYTYAGQAIYNLLLKRRNALELPRNAYIAYSGNNYNPTAKMVHFFTCARFNNNMYVRIAKKIIRELRTYNFTKD